jgi:hypothetical protein
MVVDTHRSIAILGAGPIGLEAALYARFLGYEVQVYEQGEVGNHIRQWGHVRLFSPFGMNRSALALVALAAQNPKRQPPTDEQLLDGHDYLDQFLLPLAQTDLLEDRIHTRTTVISVGREWLSKADFGPGVSRETSPFLLLLHDGEGREFSATADIVVDTTGVYGQHRFMGQGGLPAIGEWDARAAIDYHLPDVLGDNRATYAHRHTLVVGAGYSAATSVVALAELSGTATGTRITWVTRERANDCPLPLRVIPDDSLSERSTLTERANRLAENQAGAVEYRPKTSVRKIRSRTESPKFEVMLAGQFGGTVRCDRIIANVGFRPDASIHDELQVRCCHVSEGPVRLAASLLEQVSTDCLDQQFSLPETLITTEPNFYILGSKSYGRDSRFLISIGLEQIRQLFTLLTGQADLDLYRGVDPFVPTVPQERVTEHADR